MPTLKTLEIRALRSSNRFLEAWIGKVERERDLAEEAVKSAEEEKHRLEKEIISLKNTLDEYNWRFRALEEARDNLDKKVASQQDMVANLLYHVPLGVVLLTKQQEGEFMLACDQRQHLVAIRLLKNSNPNLRLGLKEAKDLYDKKYRITRPEEEQPATVPDEGRFRAGQKVRAVRDMTALDRDGTSGKLTKNGVYGVYEVSEGKVLLIGSAHTWDESCFVRAYPCVTCGKDCGGAYEAEVCRAGHLQPPEGK